MESKDSWPRRQLATRRSTWSSLVVSLLSTTADGSSSANGMESSSGSTVWQSLALMLSAVCSGCSNREEEVALALSILKVKNTSSSLTSLTVLLIYHASIYTTILHRHTVVHCLCIF